MFGVWIVWLLLCQAADLRLRSFLLRDSVYTANFHLRKYTEECSDVIHVAKLVILLSIHFLPPFIILFMT